MSETERRNCSKTIFGERMRSWQCRRRGSVQRDGKWYCKQHDPEAVQARRRASDQAYKDERAANEAVRKAGAAVAKRLGCGAPNFEVRWRGRSGYSRHIVISFEEAEQLISRLEKK